MNVRLVSFAILFLLGLILGFVTLKHSISPTLQPLASPPCDNLYDKACERSLLVYMAEERIKLIRMEQANGAPLKDSASIEHDKMLDSIMSDMLWKEAFKLDYKMINQLNEETGSHLHDDE